MTVLFTLALICRVDLISTYANNTTRSPFEQASLRSIMTGVTRTRVRLVRSGKFLDPTCPWWSAAPESLEHLFWQCPAWATRGVSPKVGTSFVSHSCLYSTLWSVDYRVLSLLAASIMKLRPVVLLFLFKKQ